MCMINEMAARIKELEQQRDEMVAQNNRLRRALEYSNSYLLASQLNTIGHGSKAHIEMKDALAEFPAQSLEVD